MKLVQRRPQPQPTRQPVKTGDRVLAMADRTSVSAAVVTSVRWTPKPNKPVSWERDRQWLVEVQFYNGTKRSGGWNPEWVTQHDEEHWVMACLLAEMGDATKVAYYEMWHAIEDALSSDGIA